MLQSLKSNTTQTPVREKKKPKRVSKNESKLNYCVYKINCLIQTHILGTGSTKSEAAPSSGRPIRSAAEKAKQQLVIYLYETLNFQYK